MEKADKGFSLFGPSKFPCPTGFFPISLRIITINFFLLFIISDAQTATPSGIPSTPTANRLRVGSLGTVSDAIGFCPDYTVVASTELSYLTINRELYAAGRNATQIERSRQRAKMRGEGASVSFPSSPMLPRDDRFSALYLANSTESLATAHERRDSKRITFKDGECFFFFFLHW